MDASLKLGFIIGFGVALAGRWVNSGVGALAIVLGAGLMLYAGRQTRPKANPPSHTTLGL